MQSIRIQVRGKDDAEPCFPEFNNAAEGSLGGIAILEAGMVSGKTSVGVIVLGPKGPVLTELSAEAFLTIAAAVKGAMARFGQKWDGV